MLLPAFLNCPLVPHFRMFPGGCARNCFRSFNSLLCFAGLPVLASPAGFYRNFPPASPILSIRT